MADFKFECGRCGQRIQCDEAWSGHKLQCPSCQNEMVAPVSPANARQVLTRFQASADTLARFQQRAESKSVAWELSEALSQSPMAVRADWKADPAELVLGFKERLQTSEVLRGSGLKVDIVEDGEADSLKVALSTPGKPARLYRWAKSEKADFHTLVFAFAQLLPPGLAIFSLKLFEETDTAAYLLGPKDVWDAVRQLLGGCFDQIFAAHVPKRQFELVRPQKTSSSGRRPDWRKLWDIYGGPATRGTPEEIAQSLDILRPMSPKDLFYGKDKVLRTNGISFFLHDITGKPLEDWYVARNPARLPTILHTYAIVARVGVLWNLYAQQAFPGRRLSGNCLGRGFLIWAYFIHAAMGAEAEARECGRLLELEKVQSEERSGLFRGVKSHYDLALFLHNGRRGDELGLLEPMLPLAQREAWQDDETVTAAVKAHCQTRGEQFVHEGPKWTWPATLYALARRANALDLLPRDNPFLDTPLDVAQVDQADPWLGEFLALEQRLPSGELNR